MQYRERERARIRAATRLAGTMRSLGYLRLLLVVAALGLFWWWHHDHGVPGWSVPVPLILFVPLAAFHARVIRQQKRAERAAGFYRAGVGRIEDRWMNAGQQEPRGAYATSLFAADLDLFGRASLFALLSTARTRIGEETLAGWLLGPSPVAEILGRQKAVAELQPQLDLREDLAMLGPEGGDRGNHDELFAWAEAPVVLPHGWVRLIALVLAIAAAGALSVWWTDNLRLPFLVVILVEAGVLWAHRSRMANILAGAQKALADLDVLASLLARAEAGTSNSEALREIESALTSGGTRASAAIAKLRTIGMLLDSRDNVLLRVADVPLLYSLQLAYAAEAWRREHGAHVRGWLRALGRFEALVSLAGYAAEHPADRFPEFVEGRPCFVATALGHPLLPAAQCVRNDLALGGEHPVVLISGSNMSGKSTLLRSVGLNTVLAMAGAPVRAERLQLTPLAIGASILVQDSLSSGASRFYAEIQRLRAVCDLAEGPLPLLFLLDELLGGTNSHDRQIGATGVLRTLAARGAIGLATTHDLALTEMASEGASPFRNMHFEDAVIDGRMTFDYHLREGILTRSNGVELMRLIGLDV